MTNQKIKISPKAVLHQIFLVATMVAATNAINAQNNKGISSRFSIHAQATAINQYKPAFTAKYTGDNSLSPQQEDQTSFTSTLYLGARLWKGASMFINPEVAGGSGLSHALGIANATNGETFRIGSPALKLYLARFYYRQVFALSDEKTSQESDFNQLKENVPVKYFSFTVGKISIADFFDNNKYSHNPRTQFMSWGLMDNGSWDYPANTRGYTTGVVLEYVSPKNEIRYSAALVPLVANGNIMNKDISKASSHNIEYTHWYTIKNRKGGIRLLSFFNTANMGDYRQSITGNPILPSIISTRKYGNTKYGFGINVEQEINKNIGSFFRVGWNDGNKETWMFTEIDMAVSAGISLAGKWWKRENDNIGIAYVSSGISKPHRDYLKAGGKGFMLGDGNLNYRTEHLIETYYQVSILKNNIYASGAYQLLINPGYNHDRKGPINIFSVRLHTRI